MQLWGIQFRGSLIRENHIQNSMRGSRQLCSAQQAALICAGVLAATLFSTAQPAAKPAASQPSSCLPVDQVVRNLEQKDAERAAALQQFEGRRVYRMQYQGFPGNREAEMVVDVIFRAPNSKQFRIVSESGSKFIVDHVLKKLLDSEREFGEEGNRRQDALTSQNYNFELVGCDNASGNGSYALKLTPKNKNKFLYRGEIWVDARDFAVTRIEGEPERNPSIWIRKTEIHHEYKKVDNFWLPAENRTESYVRAGGRATLSIEYETYKVKAARTPGIPKIARAESSVQ